MNALHETGSGGGASTNFMRLLIGVFFAAMCLAQTLKIPPVKASVDLENQRIELRSGEPFHPRLPELSPWR